MSRQNFITLLAYIDEPYSSRSKIGGLRQPATPKACRGYQLFGLAGERAHGIEGMPWLPARHYRQCFRKSTNRGPLGFRRRLRLGCRLRGIRFGHRDPGQTAQYSLSLAAVGGFNQSVSCTCNGAPAEASCLISPFSATPGGSSATALMVSVSTTAPSQTPEPTWLLLAGY